MITQMGIYLHYYKMTASTLVNF